MSFALPAFILFYWFLIRSWTFATRPRATFSAAFALWRSAISKETANSYQSYIVNPGYNPWPLQFGRLFKMGVDTKGGFYSFIQDSFSSHLVVIVLFKWFHSCDEDWDFWVGTLTKSPLLKREDRGEGGGGRGWDVDGAITQETYKRGLRRGGGDQAIRDSGSLITYRNRLQYHWRT